MWSVWIFPYLIVFVLKFSVSFSAGCHRVEEHGATAGWHQLHSNATHEQIPHDDWPLLGNGVRLCYLQMWTMHYDSNPRRFCTARCLLQCHRTTGRLSYREGLLTSVSMCTCIVQLNSMQTCSHILVSSERPRTAIPTSSVGTEQSRYPGITRGVSELNAQCQSCSTPA